MAGRRETDELKPIDTTTVRGGRRVAGPYCPSRVVSLARSSIDPTKYGLGLAHIPTGSLAANQAYFMIAALAWNLKTWLLNLLDLGDGAVMRFQRFRYLWIWQAGVVAMSGRNTVVLKLPAGEYFQRFGVAMARLATL